MRLAARQHMVFTRRQALQCGVSAKTIDRYLRIERWRSLHGGVYISASVVIGWEQTIRAALLACGPDSVASYASAARIWGLTDRHSRPHVTVPGPGTRQRDGVVVHRSARMEAVMHESFRVTSPMRTLVDCAATMTRLDAAKLFDQAVRRRRIRISTFADYLKLPSTRTRPGAAVMREIAGTRDATRTIDSDLETELFEVLRAGGLPVPTSQHWVETRKGRRRIDFCYPDQRIAIEADSWTEHGHEIAFEKDRIRGNELEEMGFHVLGFTRNRLRTDPVDVIATVGIALGLVPVRWSPRAKTRLPAT